MLSPSFFGTLMDPRWRSAMRTECKRRRRGCRSHMKINKESTISDAFSDISAFAFSQGQAEKAFTVLKKDIHKWISSPSWDITLLKAMNNFRSRRRSGGGICCLHFAKQVLSSQQFYDNSPEREMHRLAVTGLVYRYATSNATCIVSLSLSLSLSSFCFS